MRTKVAVLVASFAVLLFTVVGSFVGVRASSNDGAYRQLQVYSEVLSRVRSEYVEDPKIPTVTEGALHGLLESLDANSSYLSPEEYKHFKQIKGDGFRTLTEGQRVSFTVTQGQKGPQAENITPA